MMRLVSGVGIAVYPFHSSYSCCCWGAELVRLRHDLPTRNSSTTPKGNCFLLTGNSLNHFIAKLKIVRHFFLLTGNSCTIVRGFLGASCGREHVVVLLSNCRESLLKNLSNYFHLSEKYFQLELSNYFQLVMSKDNQH
jgi:hypothetical protein